ncbi:MAG: hypothetical protein ACREMO_06370 [Gemmatimonadales bacterium]
MSLFRLTTAWAVVFLWLVLWEATESTLARSNSRRSRAWRDRLLVYSGESLLLSLFAALWFASLGHGGWLLLFALLGLLMEGPARFRDDLREEGAAPGRLHSMRARWYRIGLGVARVAGAGGLLAWRLA